MHVIDYYDIQQRITENDLSKWDEKINNRSYLSKMVSKLISILYLNYTYINYFTIDL